MCLLFPAISNSTDSYSLLTLGIDILTDPSYGKVHLEDQEVSSEETKLRSLLRCWALAFQLHTPSLILGANEEVEGHLMLCYQLTHFTKHYSVVNHNYLYWCMNYIPLTIYLIFG